VLAQFEPRASPRGKHARKNHPLLLDCGKSCCPFSKVPHSPGKSMPVDDHAFSDPIYVKVSLSLLGFDASLWGDLQHFFGEVRDWYYHVVHDVPFFNVDFKGSIGIREVRVQYTEIDHEKTFSSMQRALHFGESLDTSGLGSILRAPVADRGRDTTSTGGRPKEFSLARGDPVGPCHNSRTKQKLSICLMKMTLTGNQLMVTSKAHRAQVLLNILTLFLMRIPCWN
jgi:hypothetical protein